MLVPLIREGQLLNLLRIAPDGSKRFLKGGRIKGRHALLGTLGAGARLYLCESWATGATLHAATGCPVACAMHAGNLLAAGWQLWREYPDCELAPTTATGQTPHGIERGDRVATAGDTGPEGSRLSPVVANVSPH